MAIRFAALFLLAIFLAPPAWAQTAAPAPAVAPNPQTLQSGWWRYISEAGDQLPQRVTALTRSANDTIQALEQLSGQPDEVLNRYYERLRLNLDALPALVAEVGQVPQSASPVLPEYSVQDYLKLERNLRQTRREAEQLKRVIDRAEESTRSAQRRIDSLLAAYLLLDPADSERIRRGLQIMASRSELAISQQQLRVRKETLAAYLLRTEDLVGQQDEARKLLRANSDELGEVESRLVLLQGQLEKSQVELRERQARALGTQGETPAERSNSALRSLRVVETELAQRTLQLDIALKRVEQSWLNLRLANEKNNALLGATREQASETRRMLEHAKIEFSEWEQQAEQDLVSLRLSDIQNADSQLAKINEDRVTSANEVLRKVALARGAAEDLGAVLNLVQLEIADEQGVFGGGLSATWLWLNDIGARAAEWGQISLFKLGDTPVTALGILRFGLILLVAVWLSRLLRHALERLGSRSDGTKSAFYTVGRLAHYVILGAAIIIGLSSIGLSFSNLAIVAGALGVGIGFGLQSIVNNFVSGLILLFERSLKVGDYVQLESGVGGIVKEINVRSTLINTNDNLDILVPNSEFVSGRLTNWTLKDVSRRMHIPFGVAYGSDKGKVKQAVLDGIKGISIVVKDSSVPAADVWLINFGDSSLDFELVVWVKQAAVRSPGQVHASFTWAIETALKENGIEIPFPQRDLHLRSGFETSREPSNNAV